MITIVSDRELPSAEIGLWMKAQQAVEAQNYKYAVSILRTLIKRVPGFLTGRKVLRACEVKITPEAGRRSSLFTGVRLTTTRKDPETTITTIEDELEKDPYSIPANETLFAAATDLGLAEMAAFALETICQGQPNPKKHLHLLANHYIKNEQFSEAAETYRRVLKLDRTDPVAMRGEKDCAARASMRQGNWEGSGDFRTKMKNQNATAELESADKVGLTRAEMEARLAQLSQEYASDNTNLQVVKGIASIYEQMEDYANAYSFYAYAFQLSGNTDFSINEKAMEMREMTMQAELAYYEQVLAADPNNEEAKAALAQRKKEIAIAVVADAKARVDANPTDAALQLKYGQALYDAEQYSEAIPALQRARNNPNLRIKAMLVLGRCYAAKNMSDMAIRQLEDACAEHTGMDDTKKDLLYLIGDLYSQVGNKEKALENFKKIYEVDYGYKDVANRVESAYS